MPQVSIITPCYNSSEFLEETIQSVLHQNFTDWEWIITDDKSTDNSVEIINKHQGSRIILIEAEKNRGAGHARNLALEKASCSVYKHKIEKQIYCCRNNSHPKGNLCILPVFKVYTILKNQHILQYGK